MFNISLSSCRSKMTHFLHSVKMAGNEHTLLKHEKPPRRNFSTNFNYSSEVDIEGLVDETTDIPPDQRLHDGVPVSSCMKSAADWE